jgi:hypothetical protein
VRTVFGRRVYVLLSPSSGPIRLGVLDQSTGIWQAQLPPLGIVTPYEDEPDLYKVTSSGVVIGPPGDTGPYTVLTNKDSWHPRAPRKPPPFRRDAAPSHQWRRPAEPRPASRGRTLPL